MRENPETMKFLERRIIQKFYTVAIRGNSLLEFWLKNTSNSIMQVEEVLYTDKTRNMAVVVGIKDVKSEIKDKNRL